MIPAHNLFRVTQSMGDVVAYSGAMRRLAIEVGKVASDLRLLSMGPRAGLAGNHAAGGAAGFVDHAGQGESVGPRDGQSGLLSGDRLRHDDRDGGEAGQLELNVMMPVIAWNALHASTILRESMTTLRDPDDRRPDGEPGSRPRAARPQHRDRHRAQPVHRLRRDRRNREGSRSRPDSRFATWCSPRGLLDAKRLDEILPVEAMTAERHRGCEAPEASGRRVRQDKAARHETRDSMQSLELRFVRRGAVACCPGSVLPGRQRARSPSRATASCSRRRSSVLLEAPDRDQWQKPDLIMDALLIAEGSVVADLGAGGGWFTAQLSAPRRTQRHRLRRGHPAGDDRQRSSAARSART